MAKLTIHNLTEASKVTSITCEKADADKITLSIKLQGQEPLPFTIPINDAQMLQSWFFLNIKKVKA